jgi:TonB family protein
VGKKPLELTVKTYELDLESVPLEVKKNASGSITLRLKDGSEEHPVLLVDGKKVKGGVENLNPDEIESIKVIKDSDDPLVKEYNAKQGIIVITTKKPATELKPNEEVFYVVEDMPTFNGGDPAQEFRKFIAQNLEYPESAAKKGIEGRVIVQFMVDTEGEVANAIVVRSVDPALDKEAIRVVNSSSKWTPGKQRGKKVNVLFTFPINFVLQDTDKSMTLSLKADKFTIQGDGSMSEPVYVLDGKVVETIEGIDPESIERMDVIKDPESPFFKKYNAKDGVIMITTKEAAKLEKTESFEKDGEVFYIVEDMPKYPGGKPAMKTYIYSNLEYPEQAKSQGIEGEVMVQFMVNQQGKVEQEKVVRSTYEGFNEAALKVIREMPDWTPGKQRGKAVRVQYVVPIKFNKEKN